MPATPLRVRCGNTKEARKSKKEENDTSNRRLGCSQATAVTPHESSSFLKKRSKRLLFLRNSPDLSNGPHLSASAEIKVFLLLFLQKKKILT
jgi:hypothetical protein